MMWLTWRQFRIQALIGYAVLAAIAVVFLASRPGLMNLARDSGYLDCTSNCQQLGEAFIRQAQNSHYAALYYASEFVLYGIPAVVGLFWGAPMVARELETGTYRLVWNQTVSRTRWLAFKLVFAGAATAVLAGLASLVINWWAYPIDRAQGRMIADVFAARGVVPIGYAVFAFVAGVTVGVLIRRSIPAMVVTFAVVAAALVASPFLLRPHLVAHDSYSAALKADQIGSIGMRKDDTSRSIRVEAQPDLGNAWVLSTQLLDAGGKEYTGPYDPSTCGPEARAGPDDCRKWIEAQNLTVKADYIPATKFWALQWREFGVFLVASAALAIFCFWWIRRRVA